MTWASLWWRVCLLARLHARRVRVAWLLWRRSRRTLRVVAPLFPPLPKYELRYGPAAYGCEVMLAPASLREVPTATPGDIAYLPRRGLPATVYVHAMPSEGEARRILNAHEALLQQQRDTQR